MSDQETLNKIHLIVGELNGKVDGINNRLDRQNGSLMMHDTRINKVEDKVSKTEGKIIGFSLVGGILVMAVKIIVDLLQP